VATTFVVDGAPVGPDNYWYRKQKAWAEPTPRRKPAMHASEIIPSGRAGA
ncbi:uncharacterized protein METZ01_LOCUS492638, partial [marine metagenome]